MDENVILFVLIVLIVIIFFRVYSNFTAEKTNYSLGNIIGKSYIGEHWAIVDANGHDGKFGHFLAHRQKLTNPEAKGPESWWDNNENYVTFYPEFNENLRNEINEYKDWKITSQPTTPDTCVVHMRVGDFLTDQGNRKMEPDLIVKALSKLPRVPDRIELLNGGVFHTASGDDEERNKKSLEILENLEKSIKDKFPNSEVVKIDNSIPDSDFYRMVNAPMLVTGLGSFATMAAAANKNFRLTPEFTINDKDRNARPARRLLEDWYTYTPNSLDS